MLYITGIHALNLPCGLETCGDWHVGAIQWERPRTKESTGSLFGDYGIEHNKSIPEHEERFSVANHIRAILDLLEDGLFSVAQGMNDDFICNPAYDGEVFDKVYEMRALSRWQAISDFMGKEYRMKWVRYLEGKGDTVTKVKDIHDDKYIKIDGITTDNLEEICIMKTYAYNARDKLRDLYDITFLGNHYWDELSDVAKHAIKRCLEYKGIEQFDYLISQQSDELIDNDKLAADFLMLYDRLGLLAGEEAAKPFR